MDKFSRWNLDPDKNGRGNSSPVMNIQNLKIEVDIECTDEFPMNNRTMYSFSAI